MLEGDEYENATRILNVKQNSFISEQIGIEYIFTLKQQKKKQSRVDHIQQKNVDNKSMFTFKFYL